MSNSDVSEEETRKDYSISLIPISHTKPTHSFATLIAFAILQSKSKKCTLSHIYQWISDHFPYYDINDSGWQNSIRHNLSINPSFIKCEKSKYCKGHFWQIKPSHRSLFPVEDVTEMTSFKEVILETQKPDCEMEKKVGNERELNNISKKITKKKCRNLANKQVESRLLYNIRNRYTSSFNSTFEEIEYNATSSSSQLGIGTSEENSVEYNFVERPSSKGSSRTRSVTPFQLFNTPKKNWSF
ncbi:forkhead box transcription factor NDAI_0K01590 [Naumovozyma dairenensis CBS 421]|uniref:Fork-head domain-containing protein n=1 Tax=Naumovozyma dairenensis (strain ATCC 10597 / BCRC 20456 / CBS 421 / NBRC 0211 / NRRL Y-12639) TaxID=1071378 RepID=G0WHT9_NAUDC|nr:hypothetical protein NDAI_0K01590 [Naumovozyma dairenensis CBS 421]CCD27350.1 hypothetical protein NDAI_0K01590 [Naumovozyma dairenensis CBS 421]